MRHMCTMPSSTERTCSTFGAERSELQQSPHRRSCRAGALRDHARVGGIDAVHVGVDVAAIGMDGGSIATAEVPSRRGPSVVMRLFPHCRPWSRPPPRLAALLEA